MSRLELPSYVPDSVRRCLVTLAAAQPFPCLELPLRLRIEKSRGV
jgi:hypothetical protein